MAPRPPQTLRVALGVAAFLAAGLACVAVAGYLGAAGLVLVGLAEAAFITYLLRTVGPD